MNVGIIGAGRIAGTLAQTMAGMKTVKLYAVGARSLERAQDFAKEYKAEKTGDLFTLRKNKQAYSSTLNFGRRISG